MARTKQTKRKVEVGGLAAATAHPPVEEETLQIGTEGEETLQIGPEGEETQLVESGDTPTLEIFDYEHGDEEMMVEGGRHEEEGEEGEDPQIVNPTSILEDCSNPNYPGARDAKTPVTDRDDAFTHDVPHPSGIDGQFVSLKKCLPDPDYSGGRKYTFKTIF